MYFALLQLIPHKHSLSHQLNLWRYSQPAVAADFCPWKWVHAVDFARQRNLINARMETRNIFLTLTPDSANIPGESRVSAVRSTWRSDSSRGLLDLCVTEFAGRLQYPPWQVCSLWRRRWQSDWVSAQFVTSDLIRFLFVCGNKLPESKFVRYISDLDLEERNLFWG